jgi:thiamine biosynthesis lipoprotein
MQASTNFSQRAVVSHARRLPWEAFSRHLGHLLLSVLAATHFGLPFSRAYTQEISTPPPKQPAASPVKSPAASPGELPVQGFEIAFPAMGTMVELKAFHADQPDVQRAFAAAQQRVVELEAILTDYDPTSETRQLSQLASLKPTSVSDPLWHMLVDADRWYRSSHGAFDASLGQLTHLWRKYRRTPRRPSQGEVAQALSHSGWRFVQLNPEQRSVQFLDDHLRLDFGGIGKGFVVDQAFEVLKSHGLNCVLVNVSGNMRAGEAPPQRPGWRIEIAPLEQGGQPLRRIYLAHAAIATSGDLWQFTMIDGVRRSHILDPQTGFGVAGPLCATVLSPTATDADALATVACIVSFDRAQQLANQIGHTELLIARRCAPQATHTNASSASPPTRSEPNDPPVTEDAFTKPTEIHIEQTEGFPTAL